MDDVSDSHPNAPGTMTQAFKRGLAGRCPRCGEGALFDGWYDIRRFCAACDFELEPVSGDTWGFMYVTSIAFIGVFVIGLVLFKPPVSTWGRVAMVATALGLAIATLPKRKGVAIALHYLLETRGPQ